MPYPAGVEVRLDQEPGLPPPGGWSSSTKKRGPRGRAGASVVRLESVVGLDGLDRGGEHSGPGRVAGEPPGLLHRLPGRGGPAAGRGGSRRRRWRHRQPERDTRTIGRVLAEFTEAGSLSHVGGWGRHCESARLPGTARRRRQIQSPRLVD
jgi:hypothetical protein